MNTNMNMSSIASSNVSFMFQPPRDELLKQARHAAETSGVHRSEICRRATTSPTKQKWDGLLAFGLVYPIAMRSNFALSKLVTKSSHPVEPTHVIASQSTVDTWPSFPLIFPAMP